MMQSYVDREMPRTSLDRALAVVEAVADGGGPLTRDGIAEALGVQPGTGSANTRTIAAKKFGLIARGRRGGYDLTPLGRRVAARPDDPDGLAEAIVHVPVFKTLVDRFSSRLSDLSPADLLAALSGCGVPEERLEEASRVFRKSWSLKEAKERTTEPAADGDASDPQPEIRPRIRRRIRPVARPDAPPDATGLGEHPLFAQMVAAAPPPGTPWPGERRDAWLDMVAAAVRLLYPPSG